MSVLNPIDRSTLLYARHHIRLRYFMGLENNEIADTIRL